MQFYLIKSKHIAKVFSLLVLLAFILQCQLVPEKAIAETFSEIERTDLQTQYSKTFQTGPETFRQEASIIDDTWIDSGYPGGFPALFRSLYVGSFVDYNACISGSCPTTFSGAATLLKFGSVLPADSVVTSATLKLFQTGGTKNTMPPIQVRVDTVGEHWDSTRTWPIPAHTETAGATSISYYNALTSSSIKEIAIPLHATIFNRQEYNPDYGFIIMPLDAISTPGVRFCASEGSNKYCLDQHDPKLIITYTKNTPPYTPELALPQSGTVFSGYCDNSEGAGICNAGLDIPFSISGIGDSEGGKIVTEVEFRGDEQNISEIEGTGEISFTRHFSDGTTFWKGRSRDSLSAYGNYSPEFVFTVDTKPPTIPALSSLASWSQSQVNLTFPKSVDEISPNSSIQYLLEYSNSSTFLENVYTKTWQLGTSFEIGTYGADEIQFTQDDLEDGKTYYFRAKARDAAGNISAWSSAEQTTLDQTKPVIIWSGVDHIRFSPNSVSSAGVVDTVEYTVVGSEENLKEVTIEIKDLAGTTIYNHEAHSAETSHFIWNGVDLHGNIVADGAYMISAILEDYAGNVNESSGEQIVIVDNSQAGISISSPFDGYWTHKDILEITGQVGSPHISEFEDTDFEYLMVQNTSTHFDKMGNPDQYGLFSEEMPLQEGENKLTLRVMDSVGNITEKDTTVYKDTHEPVLAVKEIDEHFNNKRPAIHFVIEDSDSGLYSGINPQNILISLTGSTQGIHYQKNIFADGIKLEENLIEDILCRPQSEIVRYNNLDVSKKVECTLVFSADLDSGIDFVLGIKASDVAGVPVSTEKHFIIDTYIFHEVYTPVADGLYNNSHIAISGKSSRHAILLLENKSLGLRAEFAIEPELHSTGKDVRGFIVNNFEVHCVEFVNTEEVCTWNVITQASFFNINQNALNELVLLAHDESGNSIQIIRNFTVNTFLFSLQLGTNLSYISPNGDGIQDTLVFSHTLLLNETIGQPDIEWYQLLVQNPDEIAVKRFWGEDYLPLETIWDLNNEELADGQYNFLLTVQTKDGVVFSTRKSSFFIKRKADGELLFTSPKDGSITSRGVITVTGFSPQKTVTICVKNRQLTQDTCVYETQQQADANGFFSGQVLLDTDELIDKKTFTVSASTMDEYGNRLQVKNPLMVIKDSSKSIISVHTSPELTGITSDADFQKFLHGELNINAIRTIQFKIEVSQNTEQINLAFADKTNFSGISPQSDFKHIGVLTDASESDTRLNPENNPAIKHIMNLPLGHEEIPFSPCKSITCTWSYFLPIDGKFSGIYELRIRSKKGEMLEETFTGFSVDGTAPAAPRIARVETYEPETGVWRTLEEQNGIFYTNQTSIRLLGIGEPNSHIRFTADHSDFLTASTGLWTKTISLEPFLSCVNDQNCVTEPLMLDFTSFKNNGEVDFYSIAGSNPAHIVFDSVKPAVVNVSKKMPAESRNNYAKNGSNIEYAIQASEPLKYLDLGKNDGFTQKLTESNAFTWTGMLLVSTNFQGEYSPDVRLMDFAGNKAIVTTADVSSDIAQKLTLIVDETFPESAYFETVLWGKDGGWKADGINPETGRLSPSFVTKSDTVLIEGWAEAGQRVQIFTNGNKINTVEVENTTCKSKSDDITGRNNRVIKNGTLCMWHFTYTFPGTGKKNVFGAPSESYIFQAMVLDDAGNNSGISQTLLVYHDTSPPLTPVMQNQQNTILTNQLAIEQTFFTERFADLEAMTVCPQNCMQDQVAHTQSSSDGIGTLHIQLGSHTDAGNCVSATDGSQKGICEDGIYSVSLRSYDAPGNASGEAVFHVRRDTVPPLKPIVLQPYLCEEYVCLTVSGEIGARVLINNNADDILSQNQQTVRVLKNWKYGEKYSIEVSLQDLASNISESATLTYSTPLPALFKGSASGASRENPYGVDESSGNIKIDVQLRYGNQPENQYSAQIPEPRLTLINTLRETRADAYGTSVSINSKVYPRITTSYLTYNEALSKCGLILTISADDFSCMERSMGITSLWDWRLEKSALCLYAIPVLTQSCLWQVYQNHRMTLMQDEEAFAVSVAPVVSLFNQNNEKVVDFENKFAEGRFTKSLAIPTQVSSGDSTRAKVSLSGNFTASGMTIFYSGESGWSNSLQVDEAEYVNVQGKQAKVLPVPYFNQYLEADGKTFAPEGGWYMCGAASSVMVAGYFGKLAYDKSNEFSLKKYMYSDSGQGIISPCNGLSGAFALTSYRCEQQSWMFGVAKYLKFLNLNFKI